MNSGHTRPPSAPSGKPAAARGSITKRPRRNLPADKQPNAASLPAFQRPSRSPPPPNSHAPPVKSLRMQYRERDREQARAVPHASPNNIPRSPKSIPRFTEDMSHRIHPTLHPTLTELSHAARQTHSPNAYIPIPLTDHISHSPDTYPTLTHASPDSYRPMSHSPPETCPALTETSTTLHRHDPRLHRHISRSHRKIHIPRFTCISHASPT